MNRQPLLPSAYNRRDILGLKKISEWTSDVEKIHFEDNRILQPGFMYRNSHDVYADAKLAGVEWLTDVCCPTVNTAIMLHIAKEMVVNYKIKEEELNIVAQSIFDKFSAEYKNDFSSLEMEIEKNHLTDDVIEAEATKLLNQNNINPPTLNQLQAARRLVIDNERKKITDAVISAAVKNYLTANVNELNLSAKPVNEIGKSHDFSILGAAGSGKSTIARQYFTDEAKADYIVLATDNYRVFRLPGTESHEEKNTKNIFTRTQDMAYLIKDLVKTEIDLKVKNDKARPDVICDCVTLEPAMRELLLQGETTSVIAAYRGEPGYVGIAERAESRAQDPSASSADKGRYVETTDLLKGHADASARLLSSIPQNTITTIFDTAVEKGKPPNEIARVDSVARVMEIDNLRVMSEFLNKQNINVRAINQVDLIFKNHPLNMLATHPENKAKSILELIPETEYKKAYTVKLKHNNIVYAEIIPAKNPKDRVTLNILDKDLFLQKSTAETIEAAVLRAITRQVVEGDLKTSFKLAQEKGDRDSFLNSYSKHDKKSETFPPRPKPR